MKIILAGGFPVISLKGREKELVHRFNYNRLHSFYFLDSKTGKDFKKFQESLDVLINYNKERDKK